MGAREGKMVTECQLSIGGLMGSVIQTEFELDYVVRRFLQSGDSGAKDALA